MCTLVNALWGNKIGTAILEGNLTVPLKLYASAHTLFPSWYLH